MVRAGTFDEVLDAVETLTPDEQADMIDLVQRRLAERRRENLIASVRESEAEYASGVLKPKSVAEIMAETRR